MFLVEGCKREQLQGEPGSYVGADSVHHIVPRVDDDLIPDLEGRKKEKG